MQLDYGTILCPDSITLSIGILRKPTLREIAKLTFDKFGYYEFFLKMTPELFYTKIKGDDGKAYWDSLTEESKNEMTLFDVISEEESLQKTYTDILNFFFVESVTFREGFFILLKEDIGSAEEIDTANIRGVIAKETFPQVLEFIQQICCIYDKDADVENQNFKNKLAKRLYEKMLKAKKKENDEKKADINLTLPNIISSVSNKHPTISPITVWDLTVFQLLDSFNRTQINTMYDIDATRVSVWGDEKKTFNASLWYKNEYDKK